MTDVSDLASLPPQADQPLTTAGGGAVIHPSRQDYVSTVEGLRVAGFELCSDLCAVDYLNHLDRELPAGTQPERFEVVVVLTSLARRQRVRLRVQVPESDPTLPTLFGVYPGAEAMEREAYDMFGIIFRRSSGPDAHPHARRLGRSPASQGLLRRSCAGAVQRSPGASMTEQVTCTAQLQRSRRPASSACRTASSSSPGDGSTSSSAKTRR